MFYLSNAPCSLFMRNLPKLSQLQIFESIIQHGSFRSAAKTLNQAQPALTRAINELEKTLGTSLMVRGPKGVVLTEAGQLLEPRIQLILRELERAVNEVEQVSYSSRGSVALGSSSLPFFTMLPAAIKRFQKRFPQVNIYLTEGQIPELLSDIRHGKLDFAIGTTGAEAVAGDFITEPFFTASFCVLARKEHPLAQSTSLEQLEEAKWYLPGENQGYHSQLTPLLFPKPHHPYTVVRGDTITAGLQMVFDADFLIVASKEMLKVPYLKDHLCTLPLEKPLPDATYHFIYSQRLSLTLVARKLMDKLQWECKNYVWN
ncbi:LysR substrate-binding domain-containing protein [Serratia sp. Ag1]|uniref:LysR substrate-binding domain-containing protein n=1 Tax=Serratia sp. Ag1 TaxID=1524467 RepID=UPI000ACDFC99|nr:LysR substrate-binding domain-containing protein [Serratia sp. Ag1]